MILLAISTKKTPQNNNKKNQTNQRHKEISPNLN